MDNSKLSADDLTAWADVGDRLFAIKDMPVWRDVCDLLSMGVEKAAYELWNCKSTDPVTIARLHAKAIILRDFYTSWQQMVSQAITLAERRRIGDKEAVNDNREQDSGQYFNEYR